MKKRMTLKDGTGKKRGRPSKKLLAMRARMAHARSCRRRA